MRYCSKTILFIFFFYSIISVAQKKETFYDENMKEIDSAAFFLKCNAAVFKCLTYKSDSLVVNKVYQKYKFGILNKVEYNQIKTLLTQDSNLELSKDNTIIIRFNDTIFGYEHYVSRIKSQNEAMIRKHPDSSWGRMKVTVRKIPIMSKRQFIKNHQKFIKRQQKCTKIMLEEYKVKKAYYYNVNINHNELFLDLNWSKTDHILSELFFPFGIKSSYLIIKPNRQYFISQPSLSNKQIFKLLKDDWKPMIQDVKKMIRLNSKKRIGFFITPHSHSPKKCY